jgi:23S rRNA pseudouridine2605 synthase
LKKAKPQQGEKRVSRTVSKRRPLDPKAASNRSQKEARLLREKGLKEKSKTDTESPRKSTSTPFEQFKKKIVHTPPDEDRPRKVKPPEEIIPRPPKKEKGFEGEMRLNKYLAHCGIASRRAADTMIMQGHVTVNGTVVQEMGYKVKENDVVVFKGKPIKPVDKLVYILLNKPRNVLCTSSDEKGRKTVIDIIAEKVPERVYPVGRLDRNTSGLILLTNDGDLTKKLSHPSHKVPKVYQVTLDKNLSLKDLEQIRTGITLEDGEIKADSLHFIEGESKREVQIELHSGKNRIVRRIFESLGYEVVKLDRVYYAGLTKKNLPRGFYRPLTKEEVRMLKHFT